MVLQFLAATDPRQTSPDRVTSVGQPTAEDALLCAQLLGPEDSDAAGLAEILLRKPVLHLGNYGDGVAMVVTLNTPALTWAPSRAEIWTAEDLALAACLDPDLLALVRLQKRLGPLSLPAPHPPVAANLQLPVTGVAIPPDLPSRLGVLMAVGPPIRYAGWASCGADTKTDVGTLWPTPVFYIRSEAYRPRAPALGEIWSPEELAAWALRNEDERLVLRRWKQQHGRWAIAA